MKKLFTFLILMAFFCCNSASYAQQSQLDSLSFMDLEALMDIPIYSISKQEEQLSEAPMSVYQITAEELNRWGTRYLYETIGRTPGYSFYNTDYYGQYGVMARGWQSIWRFGYSIELMPILDFGHSVFPQEFFSSMEVARGPAGLAWGSGANAGLVNNNIRSDLNGAEIVTSYGNYNQYSVSALYGNKFADNEGSMFFGINQKGQDSEIIKEAFGQPGNDYRVNGVGPSYSFIGKVDYKGFKGVAYVEHADHDSPQLWFEDAYTYNNTTNSWNENIATKTILEGTNAQYDANINYANYWNNIGNYTGTAPHDQLNTVAYRMEYALPLKNDQFNISIYHNYYNKLWYMDMVASAGIENRDFGFNANLNFWNKKITMALGSDLWGHSSVNLYSNNHQYSIMNGINWFANTYGQTDFHYNNAFAQVNYNVNDKIKLISGSRIDYQDEGEFSNTIIFYREGAVYRFQKNHIVKYFYNFAPRRPQANERISTNPNPEILEAHELAFVGEINNKLNYSITAFKQKLTDQITKQDGFNDFFNTGGLDVMGIEWALRTKPVNDLMLYWNGSYNHAKIIKGIKKDDSGIEVEIAEAHNKDDQPLFVPAINSFIGAEYNVASLLKCNIALRSIYDIPYLDANGQEQKASTNFVDITLISKKFWDKLELSFVALNVLDNTDGLPAYGEHAKNQPGTISPEGRRFYLKTRFTIPSK